METQENDIAGLVELSELTAVGDKTQEIVQHVENVEARVNSTRSEVQRVDVWDNLCF